MARECTVVRSSVFFFSSRRRHTRFDCDWSSDVCSSDLTGLEDGDAAQGPAGQQFFPKAGRTLVKRQFVAVAHAQTVRAVEVREPARDRKSTRLNSSHSQISYAVFCLKKKKQYLDLLVHESETSLRHHSDQSL